MNIEGVPVVSNWGMHGTRFVEGEIQLSKGYHSINVHQFENGGGASAYALYSGPDTNNEWEYIQAFH